MNFSDVPEDVEVGNLPVRRSPIAVSHTFIPHPAPLTILAALEGQKLEICRLWDAGMIP